MKNNYEETDLNKISQIIQEPNEIINSANANDFNSQDDLDKKYNFYLSNLTNEKTNTKINFFPKRSEQIERLLEEEKNIEDENVQRLKELRTKYLSSVKTFDEEKFNFFSKNASYDTDENKLWKINYSKKDLLNNNNSRNSFENNNQIQIQNNTNNTNNEINIDMNKLSNSLNGINMAIYERKNSQNINQSYNTYKINDSDMNKTEEYNKVLKYDNLLPNQIIENNLINNLSNNYNTNLENDYNKLKYDYKMLQKDFINLMDKYNLEKNKNNNDNNNNNLIETPNKENKNDETYDNYKEKELDELKKINSNYEFILSSLINYINDINYLIDRKNLKKIDLIKIKKNIKILFPNKSTSNNNNTNNTKEHPLYPFIKLLENYKNIIYKNEKVKNIFNSKSENKTQKKKLTTYESILKSYNIKNNINNIKFKCMNSKNKFSRSIGTTPFNNKNVKTHRIFPKKNIKFLKSEKFRNNSTNRINSNTMKNRSVINTSVPKESK